MIFVICDVSFVGVCVSVCVCVLDFRADLWGPYACFTSFFYFLFFCLFVLSVLITFADFAHRACAFCIILPNLSLTLWEKRNGFVLSRFMATSFIKIVMIV